MVCETIKVANINAIICSRGRKRWRCVFCQGSGEYQCDFPRPAPADRSRKGGTCDAYLCRVHAREVGPGRHFCVIHPLPGDPRPAA